MIINISSYIDNLIIYQGQISYPSEALNFRGLLLDCAGDDGASDTNLPGALNQIQRAKGKI